MAFDDIPLTPEKEAKIKAKSPEHLPLNPTAQGYSGSEVRKQLSNGTFGNTDSILSEFKDKLDVIKGHFESFAGNVAILSALPEDLTGYNDMFIFLKNELNVITNVYYVSNNTATEARFTTSNVTVSEEEPTLKLNNDIWFDI
jgi:hypothetical protein